MREVKIVQDQERPVAAEIIAQSIVDIQKAMDALNKTRLTRHAIIILIQEKSKISRRDIELVLNNLDKLEKLWLKPKQAK